MNQMTLKHITLLASLFAFSSGALSSSTTPVFKWPAGLSSTVTVKDVSITENDDDSVEEETSIKYIMKTEKHAKGLAIAISDVDISSDNSKANSAQMSPVQKIIEAIASQYPNFLVSKEGIYIENINNEDVKRTIASHIKEFEPNVKKGHESDLEQLKQAAFSDTRLTYISSTFWHLTVGQWLNGTFSDDASLEVPYNQPMPMLGGLKVPMLANFSLRGKVPCSRNGIEIDCVRLVMEATIDKKKLNKILDMLTKNSGQSFPFDIHTIKSKHVVVTEADTLIPHKAETWNDLNISISGAQSLVRHQSGKTVFKYH